MHSLPEDHVPHRADNGADGKFDEHPKGDDYTEVSEVAEGNLKRPRPVVTADGEKEYYIDHILDERKRGRGQQYRVRWVGYDADGDTWVARSLLKDTAALEKWEASMGCEGEDKSAKSSLS